MKLKAKFILSYADYKSYYSYNQHADLKQLIEPPIIGNIADKAE